MKTYNISISPRIKQDLDFSEPLRKEILESLFRFLQGDWGNVTKRMQLDNDEIFSTNQPTARTYSTFGILRDSVYEIFGCYPLSTGGVVWMIRDVRCQNGSTPQIAVLHPMEYGHWKGPYVLEPAVI